MHLIETAKLGLAKLQVEACCLAETHLLKQLVCHASSISCSSDRRCTDTCLCIEVGTGPD
jgi:hypothetical protein